MAAKFLNPWFLNFQKLGLELKCPLCLNLVNRPVLLPCNHVVCLSCIPDSTQFAADCPVCNLHFVNQDLRHLPFLENMANIYKCLDTTFSASLIQSARSDSARLLLPSPFSTVTKFDGKNENEPPENRLEGKSGSVDSVENNSKVEQGSARKDIRGVGASSNVNPEAQSAPESPLSFGDAYNSHLQCSEHSSETSFNKRPKRENDGSRMGKLRNESSGLEQDTNFREVKRPKQLNYEKAENVSNSKQELQNVPDPIGIEMPESSTELLADQAVCAFCHSSKISEESGSMLHYSNEKLVSGHKATLPNVIHVHRLCIDWAPQVFYVDEKAKNLTAEVTRGSKLKCSKCGKKGAALGCYIKSCRRSYHVPCALKTPKCRWDNEDYLLLCPSHSSVKFPKEKSKPAEIVSEKPVMPAMVSCRLSNVAALPDKERKWLLCGSALSSEEKFLLVKFGKMNGSSVSKFWDPNVTHIIAATDETGACTRTLKVLMAILNGRWIVKVDWIKACIEAKSHVNEEPFEISHDNYGCRDSPKNGRLRAINNDPKLFAGLNFYFVGDFLPSYRKDLEDLVIVGGGALIKSREELSGQSRDVAIADQTAALVIYNLDPPEGCKLGEEVSILWRRLSEAEDVAVQTRSRVIGHTWLLESIAAYKLQPFV